LNAIAAAVDGHDVLAILPTGAGKSAIYQLAGLLRTGPTVVVSPLIALEDDQVAHLRRAGLSATVLNSKQSARTRAAALASACGTDQFVFVSPEQLANSETLEWLRRARPGLFVIDEAHLVSQWGEDFRPDYLLLAAHADALGAPVRVALTATAAPPVRTQIQQRLGLRDPRVVIGDFDRPHIDLAVDRVRSAKDKQRRVEQAASELSGAGIVYAATHAGAEAARDTLAAAGHDVSLYHAGLTTAARREAMTAFLDGSARVIAATVAFGMGIDKPDVRWVLHADAPGSLDAYYQEFGRAGRDGAAAHARLLYHPSDLALARHLAARRVSSSVLARVANRLASSKREERVDALAGALGIGSRAATLALARLVDVNAARWTTDGAARWSNVLPLPDALQMLEAQSAQEREIEGSRLQMMRRYAEHTGCRRSFLLTYFGQNYPGPCGTCDNDRRHSAPRPIPEPFGVGVRVESGRWGEGTVQRYDGEHVTVLFDDHGYRELLVPLVLERDLLRPV